MSQSESSTTIGPRLSIMDFDRFTETLQTSLSPDEPRPCLGASDLSVLINAPENYLPAANGALATLFFDPYDRVRALPPGCYQVKYVQALDASAFVSWAEESIRLLTHALIHVGFVCTDLVDLLNILRAGTSRQLMLITLPFDESGSVLGELLREFRFKTLFASLFAGQELTLELYSALGRALEDANPEMHAIHLAAHYYNCKPTVLMLGEPES